MLPLGLEPRRMSTAFYKQRVYQFHHGSWLEIRGNFKEGKCYFLKKIVKIVDPLEFRNIIA